MSNYDQVTELVEMIQRARDRAHWLAVHCQLGATATRIEQILDVEIKMAYDLRAQVMRGEVGRYHPLGGASRGIGDCTCAAGPGTNPACPVHP